MTITTKSKRKLLSVELITSKAAETADPGGFLKSIMEDETARTDQRFAAALALLKIRQLPREGKKDLRPLAAFELEAEICRRVSQNSDRLHEIEELLIARAEAKHRPTTEFRSQLEEASLDELITMWREHQTTEVKHEQDDSATLAEPDGKLDASETSAEES